MSSMFVLEGKNASIPVFVALNRSQRNELFFAPHLTDRQNPLCNEVRTPKPWGGGSVGTIQVQFQVPQTNSDNSVILLLLIY